MDNTKTGLLIRSLRIENDFTQKQLADKIGVSDKAISKWERGLGCPDVSLLEELANVLRVSVDKLLDGTLQNNDFVGGNMKKVKYYVCPVCGNVTVCTGDAEIHCCSKKLNALEAKKPDEKHQLSVEQIEDEWFIESSHPMVKDHYISFVAFATGESLHIIKQYPEWNLQVRLPKRQHGILLWYCTKDGLFKQVI